VRCIAPCVRSHPTHAVLGLVGRQFATQDVSSDERLQRGQKHTSPVIFGLSPVAAGRGGGNGRGRRSLRAAFNSGWHLRIIFFKGFEFRHLHSGSSVNEIS